jgi:hypothetical protein
MQKSFSGVLAAADIKHHIDHPIDLEENITSLSIHFEYSPAQTVSGFNLLTLTVFDAHGCRGAGHRQASHVDGRATHHVDIGMTDATPGYIPGPLPAGRWNIVIDTHSILPDAPVAYTIEITGIAGATIEAIHAPISSKPVATAKQHPGWYRGDLHAHTTHSDATWDVAAFAAFMHARGFDFATLSDHNTVAGLVEWDQLTTPDFLTIGAMELTTFYGHCLALGTRQWVDWRVKPGTRSMTDIAAEITASCAFFVIAHPMAVGDPICTGCNWLYEDMQPGIAPAVEVWNSTWDSESNNNDALSLWYEWLNQSHRMVATSGTDAHGPYTEQVELGFDMVYAERLTEDAILQAIKQGHLYISTGPSLELTGVSVSGATAMMGDSLPRDAAQITAMWGNCTGDEHLSVIVDGQVFAGIADVSVKGNAIWSLAAGQAHWCTVELRDHRNHLRAVTNPIFFGG